MATARVDFTAGPPTRYDGVSILWSKKTPASHLSRAADPRHAERPGLHAMTRRLNVTLGAEAAAELARLAERMHVQERTLARSLLATALDEGDPDARSILELLDAIPGAHE